MAHNKLGGALRAKGRLDEAMAEYRRAIAVDPKYTQAHLNLGNSLYAKNRLDEAMAEYRQAITLDPKSALAHNNLGTVLHAKGQLDAAITEYRQAIALDPKYATAHFNLGNALRAKNRLDDAIAEYKEAIAVDPKSANVHNNLGNALKGKNRLDEAIAEFNEAVILNPRYAMAYANLGDTFLLQGRFAQAEASFQRCLELRSASDPEREATEERLKQARRFIELDKKLPGILAGEKRPADSAECLDVFQLCKLKQLNAAAVRFAKSAFTDQPALADDLEKSHRYNAACVAALAAAGKGKGTDKLTDLERADLRNQALHWLRADLAAWGSMLDIDAGAPRSGAQRTMTHWKEDTDLAGVRDFKALANLPPDERDAWQKLWQDVEALQAKTSRKK
jgi:Tfp pilus assembly protein PilF